MKKQKKSQLITFQSKIDRGLADDLVVIMRKEGKSRRRMLEEFIHWCKKHNKNAVFDFQSDIKTKNLFFIFIKERHNSEFLLSKIEKMRNFVKELYQKKMFRVGGIGPKAGKRARSEGYEREVGLAALFLKFSGSFT